MRVRVPGAGVGGDADADAGVGIRCGRLCVFCIRLLCAVLLLVVFWGWWGYHVGERGHRDRGAGDPECGGDLLARREAGGDLAVVLRDHKRVINPEAEEQEREQLDHCRVPFMLQDGKIAGKSDNVGVGVWVRVRVRDGVGVGVGGG